MTASTWPPAPPPRASPSPVRSSPLRGLEEGCRSRRRGWRARTQGRPRERSRGGGGRRGGRRARQGQQGEGRPARGNTRRETASRRTRGPRKDESALQEREEQGGMSGVQERGREIGVRPMEITCFRTLPLNRRQSDRNRGRATVAVTTVRDVMSETFARYI